jgi:hypothetical protein
LLDATCVVALDWVSKLVQLPLHSHGMHDWLHSSLMEDLQHHMIIALHNIANSKQMHGKRDHVFDKHRHANMNTV